MRLGRNIIMTLCVAFFSFSALALTVDSTLENPAEEAHAKALFAEFRCMVCEGQSIADSNADLARDMRMLVRQQVKEGHSDAEVKAYLVERYGDYILFAPPLRLSTSFLWLGPFLLLLLGGLAIAYIMKRSAADKET